MTLVGLEIGALILTLLIGLEMRRQRVPLAIRTGSLPHRARNGHGRNRNVAGAMTAKSVTPRTIAACFQRAPAQQQR